MQAGTLRHRVVIQQKQTDSTNAYNEPETSWVEYATRWASIEGLRGSERTQSEHVQSEADHKIVMRHTEGVTPEMRIKHGEVIYNIASVIDPEGRDRMTEIQAKRLSF